MEAALLLFLLAGASHGTETVCDVRHSGAQCYAALGGTVYLQLTDKLSGYEHELFGNTRKAVFKRKKEIVVYYNINGSPLTDGHLEFNMKNGTLRINKIREEYSDKYIMKAIETPSGKASSHSFQLSVEAPVSSPKLVFSECLPQGGMRMTCSCDGDSPWYSWTLDGQALNDSRVSHDKKRSSVTLERGVLGTLTCTIKNHISEATVNLDVSECNGTIYVNCTSSNGTEVSYWVSPIGPNLCTSTTTTKPILQTESTIQAISGKGTAVATFRSSNHTTQGLARTTNNGIHAQWYFNVIVISTGILAGVLFLFLVLGVYFVLSRKKTAERRLQKEVCRKKTACHSTEDDDEVTYADVRFIKKDQEDQKRNPAPVEVEYGQVMIRPRY